MKFIFSSLLILLTFFCIGGAFAPVYEPLKRQHRMAPNTQHNRIFGLVPQYFCSSAETIKKNYLEHMENILNTKDNYFLLFEEINVYPKLEICIDSNWDIQEYIIDMLQNKKYFNTEFMAAIDSSKCDEKEKMLQGTLEGTLDENIPFILTSSGMDFFDTLCVEKATKAPKNNFGSSNQEMNPHQMPSSRFF